MKINIDQISKQNTNIFANNLLEKFNGDREKATDALIREFEKKLDKRQDLGDIYFYVADVLRIIK